MQAGGRVDPEAGRERTMTEGEWMACADPQKMLEFLRGRASERKLRLFAIACCRHFWTATNSEEMALASVAEMFADGEADERLLAEARRQAQSGCSNRHPFLSWDARSTALRAGYDAVLAALRAGPDPPVREAALSLLVSAYWTGPWGYDRASTDARYGAREAERFRQAATLRCIFGNPFRPIRIAPAWLTWHGGLPVSMARRMYDARDFSDMPVLADALEESGCQDQDILGHCRSGGEHVRGCWVIDLLLGKS